MNNDELLRETYRLTLENNKILHKMRRSAFFGRIFTLLFYALLIVAPLWLYVQYMAPIVEKMLQTVQQIQGTGAQAQAEFASFQELFEQIQERFGKSP